MNPKDPQSTKLVVLTVLMSITKSTMVDRFDQENKDEVSSFWKYPKLHTQLADYLWNKHRLHCY